MSTWNFPIVNTNKIYAFGMDQHYAAELIEANGIEDAYEGEYDEEGTRENYEFERDNCADDLYNLGWVDSCDGLAKKTVEIDFAGVEIYVSLEAVCKSGYYEGAVFDYHVPVVEVYNQNGQADYCEAFDVDPDCVVKWDWCGNLGLSKIHAAKLAEKVNEAIQSLRDEAEKVFQDNSEYRLGCLGVMNNGEAIYFNLEKDTASVV